MYGNSFCNISALTGTDNGFFCSRSAVTINSDAPLLRKEEYGFEQSYVINDLQMWCGELSHMPLTTRGWVLQEEVLAPRTLYFGARQVLWDCLADRACETYPSMGDHGRLVQPAPDFEVNETFLHDDELGPLTRVVREMKAAQRARADDSEENLTYQGAPVTARRQQALFKVWDRFVVHYSLRHLTFPSDKLLAISGITQLFCTRMQSRFVAGLFEVHLMKGLLWYIRTNTITDRPSYRAPSWSWASCEGYVIHASPFRHSSWTVARALNLQYEDPAVIGFDVGKPTPMTLQAYCLDMRVGANGVWTASRGIHRVPHLIVRLDTNEDISRLSNIQGAVIRTTSYRLIDNVDDPEECEIATASITATKGKGKILLAAQGIILTPALAVVSGPSPPDKAVGQTSTLRESTHYRRIGYFTLEDRKSGKVTPKWVPPECTIFPLPSSYWETRDVEEFPFDAQQGFLRTLEIV